MDLTAKQTPERLATLLLKIDAIERQIAASPFPDMAKYHSQLNKFKQTAERWRNVLMKVRRS